MIHGQTKLKAFAVKLLVIEDNRVLLSSMVRYFRLEKFSCEIAASYDEGICKIELSQYSCIVLDVNLPGDRWTQLLEFLRESKRREGVIIISACDSLDDKIKGLGLGADDYLVKPFQIPELGARVRAVIRRKYAQGANVLHAGSIKVDLQSRAVVYAGQPVPLSKSEYDILLLLMINKGRIVSMEAIAEYIKSGDTGEFWTLDFIYAHIKNLKRKLKEKGCQKVIRSAYALGYKITL
jgi:DNA-binding response OmpR family regulator